MKRYLFVLVAILTLSVSSFATKIETMEDNSNKLAVLWTSGDPEVAEKVCFMYTNNAKKQGWFDEVVLIVWGPSSKLLSENKMLQDYIKTMQESGVKIEACYYCADMYGVVDKLKAMDIEVKGMGIPLSNYLKEGWHTLTF
ncbi:DsrE family protein [Sunxiuqinia sp. sy24]|uniref:DsrE family protein n=1 Tax=Sunxiuqinia sp. sy24 TaxID=3461495 RepID=UPI004045FB8F